MPLVERQRVKPEKPVKKLERLERLERVAMSGGKKAAAKVAVVESEYTDRRKGLSKIKQRNVRDELAVGGFATAARTREELRRWRGEMEIWAGGSLVKMKLTGEAPQGGEVRGDVIGFSAASRRRLIQTLGKLRRDAPLPLFVTLTFPPGSRFLGGESKEVCDQCREAFRTWWKRIRGQDLCGLWRLEIQPSRLWKSGVYAPHFHLLVWGCAFIPIADLQNPWSAIVGHSKNSVDLERITTSQGVFSYAAKYLAKLDIPKNILEETGTTMAEVMRRLTTYGRVWGVMESARMPWAEKHTKTLDWRAGMALVEAIADVAEASGRTVDRDRLSRFAFLDAPEKLAAEAAPTRDWFVKTFSPLSGPTANNNKDI